MFPAPYPRHNPIRGSRVHPNPLALHGFFPTLHGAEAHPRNPKQARHGGRRRSLSRAQGRVKTPKDPLAPAELLEQAPEERSCPCGSA